MKHELANEILEQLEFIDNKTKKSTRQVLNYFNNEGIYVSFLNDNEEGDCILIAEGLLSKSTTCMFILKITETYINYCYKVGKLSKYKDYKLEGTIRLSDLKEVFDYLLYGEN